ncbi:hypothetical protein GCWU000341_00467 [Oribacterium sp. oral taxon 078 str. F0262]|nr:hypothetical protein GCWU000341_00467 [Oribacterium sp. oral taxon 078 str. F0262]
MRCSSSFSLREGIRFACANTLPGGCKLQKCHSLSSGISGILRESKSAESPEWKRTFPSGLQRGADL